MAYDVVLATKEVARCVCSCGNFCSPIQNIVLMGTARFQDAGKIHGPSTVFNCCLQMYIRISQYVSFWAC
jgi:hypothetical protein